MVPLLGAHTLTVLAANIGGFMKHIHYSVEQIERLPKDIRIKHFDQSSLRFTFKGGGYAE